MKKQEDIAQLCGVNSTIDAVAFIDEFDANFDQLAMASLRYHLDYSVVGPMQGKERKKFEDLLRRFEDSHIRTFPDEFHKHKRAKHRKGKNARSSGDCKECQKFFDDFNKNLDRKREEQQQARHDFVDIMRSLWS